MSNKPSQFTFGGFPGFPELRPDDQILMIERFRRTNQSTFERMRQHLAIQGHIIGDFDQICEQVKLLEHGLQNGASPDQKDAMRLNLSNLFNVMELMNAYWESHQWEISDEA